MKKIITLNFGENFIERLAELIINDLSPKTKDLSRIAIVFGGRRPALFLRKSLAKHFKSAYIPPKVFSMDGFMESLISSKPLTYISSIEASFAIYRLSKTHASAVLKGRKDFNEFLPWGNEIISFIEQLDLEDISDDKLKAIEKSAAIGFEVPENINLLLEHIVKLRSLYHKELIAKGRYSRGTKYLKAQQEIGNYNFDGFDNIVFCNFFYLHTTERQIIKTVLDKGKGTCLFQGDQDFWPTLAKTAKALEISIKPASCPGRKSADRPGQANFSLYQGFDLHSQIGLARDILKKTKDMENTVVVLPEPQAAIPLLSEIASFVKEFNLSMGYSLQRTVLYSLFDYLAASQEVMQGNKYYSPNYLKIISHPLIKNLKILDDPDITRVVVHKIEELLKGKEESSISGSLFLTLKEIEDEPQVAKLAAETLQGLGKDVKQADCRQIVSQLHKLLFSNWQRIEDFHGFSIALNDLLNSLSNKSMVAYYPFNIKVMEKLFFIKDELDLLDFNKEKFTPEQLWSIFLQRIKGELLAFLGSPLKGLQVLGLMETRSLSFDNVIILNLNEGVLPKLKVYEPLIPREVMLSLGLNRLEKEEEIQRYQFMRLIAGAKQTHLIYEENQQIEKSRFIEELLWLKQRKENKLQVVSTNKASFNVGISKMNPLVNKTSKIVDFLKEQVYSASRLKTYLDCPRKFYYQYVLGLRKENDLLDAPEADSIGIFIHEVLEENFKKFLSKKPIINPEFKKYFFKKMEDRFEVKIKRRMKSDSFLLWGIIQNRMEKFLEIEKNRKVEKIISLEYKAQDSIKLSCGNIKFRYTADRIDQLENNEIVIIDYKTGVSDVRPKSYESLSKMEMSRADIKDILKSFQLPLYYYFVSRDFPTNKVNAELYSLRTLERMTFLYDRDQGKEGKVLELCLKALDFILSEIFDENVGFEPDRDQRRCQYCPFNNMCQ